MPIVVGIDEVGYGPRLGPLVVAAVAFEVADPSVDLWERLAPVVGKRPSDRGALPVCDSKILFRPAKGIGTVEPTALAFLSILDNIPVSLRPLIERLSVTSPVDHAPWSHEGETALPVVSDPAEVRSRADSLRAAMRKKRVRLVDTAIQYLEPAIFNDRIARCGNKATVLFDLVAEVIASIVRRRPAETFFFHIGKQGGKNGYLRDIMRMFPGCGVFVDDEGKAESRYTIAMGDARAELRFLLDGEERRFEIALASIVGKYLREACMRRFNHYWCSRVPGLRPTSGYLPDADRFLAAIAPSAERMNLDRAEFVRMK